MLDSIAKTPYYRDAMALPMLTAEEEITLVARAQKNDQAARRTLLSHFMKLIVARARDMRKKMGGRVSFDDYVSEGVCGLMTAIDRFEIGRLGDKTGRQIRLSTYADTWIYALQMNLSLDGYSVVHRLSRGRMKQFFFKLPKVMRELDLRSPLSHSEAMMVAEKIGCSVDEVLSLDRIHSSEVDAAEPSGEDGSHGSILTDGRDWPEDLMAKIDVEKVLSEVDAFMERGNDRTKIVIKNRIRTQEPVDMAGLAKLLGVTRVRASKIEDEIMEALLTEIRARVFPTWATVKPDDAGVAMAIGIDLASNLSRKA